MAELSNVTRDDVEKQLFELESRYAMPTAEFVSAFRNGRLHETPDFHQWAHLSAMRDLFERHSARV